MRTSEKKKVERGVSADQITEKRRVYSISRSSLLQRPEVLEGLSHGFLYCRAELRAGSRTAFFRVPQCRDSVCRVRACVNMFQNKVFERLVLCDQLLELLQRVPSARESPNNEIRVSFRQSAVIAATILFK